MGTLQIIFVILLLACIAAIIGLSVYFTSQDYIDSVKVECPIHKECAPDKVCPPEKVCPTCSPDKACPTCPAEKVCDVCPNCPSCAVAVNLSKTTQIKIGTGTNIKCVQPLNAPSGTNLDYLTKNRLKLAPCDSANPLQQYTFTPITGTLGKYSVCHSTPVEVTAADGTKTMQYACIASSGGNSSNWPAKDRSNVTDKNLQWLPQNNELKFFGAGTTPDQGKFLSVSGIVDNASLPLSTVSSDNTKFIF